MSYQLYTLIDFVYYINISLLKKRTSIFITISGNLLAVRIRTMPFMSQLAQLLSIKQLSFDIVIKINGMKKMNLAMRTSQKFANNSLRHKRIYLLNYKNTEFVLFYLSSDNSADQKIRLPFFFHLLILELPKSALSSSLSWICDHMFYLGLLVDINNNHLMELKDPLKNRKVTTIPMPYQKSLSSEQLFPNESVDCRILQKFLKRQGRLSKKLYLELLKKVKHVFQSQPNIIKIQDPITIVGDIHGQYYDFIKLIEQQTGGSFQSTKYLFLGDYVDRGCFSIEVLALILSLKLKFKNTVYLLRGNHECRQLTSYFNFRTECLEKYDQQVYEVIMELFDCLPLAAIVNEKFLCLHGGISTEIQTIADIEKIERMKEIPKTGLFCDLMWADPVDNDNGKLNGLVIPNDSRGCSYFFGYELTKKFLHKNGLLSVVRAHEAQANGFKMYHWGGEKQFPTVITIFSAPNYCDFYNNKGAVIKFKNNTLDIQQFLQNQHPYLLPNFMDVFEWSIPFVAQKVSEMLYHLIKPDRKFEEKDAVPLQLMDKRQILQKLLTFQKSVTQQNRDYISYNGRTLDNGLLKTNEAKEYTQKKYKKSFDKKKEIDSGNEKRPVDRK